MPNTEFDYTDVDGYLRRQKTKHVMVSAQTFKGGS